MASSRKLRHVALVRTDVSEEASTSIIRAMMEELSSSETSVLTRATQRNIPEDAFFMKSTCSLRACQFCITPRTMDHNRRTVARDIIMENTNFVVYLITFFQLSYNDQDGGDMKQGLERM
jgi:hypothetical protein